MRSFGTNCEEDNGIENVPWEKGLSPESQVDATEAEREAELVKNDLYCPRCDVIQIKGKRDGS